MPGNDDHLSPSAPRHPIAVVARRTGLKPDLIRAWERRYRAVTPLRSDTRRRLYSDADIERLRLLDRASKGGRGIGQIAALSDAELGELVAGDQPVATAPLDLATENRPVQDFLDACLVAVRNLDGHELGAQLDQASVVLSRVRFLDQLIVPLMQQIGEQWQAGELRPVHEHLASATVRTFVGHFFTTPASSASAPRLLMTTPVGQLHEMGAVIAAAYASLEGWNATFLGADLPAEEIVAGILQKQARAVGLSITYPPDDPRVDGELKRLRRLLPTGVALLIGGRSAPGYGATLRRIGATHISDLEALRDELRRLRLVG